MRVIVIANGEWDSEWGRSQLTGDTNDIIICADGGANLAVLSGLLPDALVGDLDSITEINLQQCRDNSVKIKKFPREKDETDLELALIYAEEYLNSHGNQEDEILLYAAGGKRLDHLLGNIALMLSHAQKGRRIRMMDKNYEAWIALPGEEIIKGAKGQEISLISLSEQATVSAQGLLYKLDRLTLRQNSPRGISNVFTEEIVKMKIHEGILLITLVRENN